MLIPGLITDVLDVLILIPSVQNIFKNAMMKTMAKRQQAMMEKMMGGMMGDMNGMGEWAVVLKVKAHLQT